ncbi:hypothetical protein, partial [Actinomadura soli]|uniref:hypothetical protein n=1 Tax=Actinomadura soli TaxID=2508997 RepID=UPI001485DD11
FATITAAIVATGSFLAITSAPAAAQDQQGLIDQARFHAQTALLRADCKQYLTGPSFQAPDDRDPQQVAGRVPIVSTPVPAGQPAGAIASSPLFRGVRGTISVHPNFFTSDPGLPVAPAAFDPSAEQQRTIAILHEIGHLTGREGDHNQDLPRQFEYNATILNLCLAGPPPLTPLRIIRFTCSPLPQGFNYINCEAFWTGGVDPASAQWYTPRAPRQPVVTTDPINHVTTASFDCNNPGETELTYTTSVQITDRAGATASSGLTIPCGW